MVIKINEMRQAEFIDEWENGFGWIARPEEDMVRTSHAFQDDGVYLVDPLDAVNLDEKLSEYGEVKAIVVLFDRHLRDSEELAEKYSCPVYIPEWLEKSIDSEVIEVHDRIPGTDWRFIDAVDTLTGREAGLYHEKSGTLTVADALGTVDMFCGRGEKLGLNPLYRLNPPKNLLKFDVERIFCGHGKGIQKNTESTLKNTLNKARRKTPSAYFKAVKSMI